MLRPAASASMYAGRTREVDACGVALLAQLKGTPSHQLIRDANTALARMEHRGGCGCEANTGDGAGILVGMPDAFMRKAAAQAGLSAPLPPKGEFASGLVFTSHQEPARVAMKEAMERVAQRLGLKILGWRRPPTDNSRLGSTAVAAEPFIEQVFVGKLRGGGGGPGADSADFERALWLLRKQAAAELKSRDFFVASLSSRTITYKGQLTSSQVPDYYLDLVDPAFASHMAMVHSRFSTNTFPSWDRAQPNRMLCHNGEINTLRGNKNWIESRMKSMQVPFLTEGHALANAELTQSASTLSLAPFTSDDKTDSGNLDAILELLVRGSADRTLPEAMMMMVPEAWQGDKLIRADKRAFYEYHSCLMEPWDGPAMMAFSDGRYMGAVLDRNGLRPSRYYVTHDDRVLLSSEVGVLPDLDPAMVKIKGRLEPGRMFLVDFERGGIIHDEELKTAIASKRPYQSWLDANAVALDSFPTVAAASAAKAPSLTSDLNTFGYTTETLEILLAPMSNTGKEALGSMGVDIPLAVLSRQPQLPFAYFKQLFAQVTNPPIDPIREEVVMSLMCPVGPEANLLEVPSEAHCRRLIVPHPVLSDEQLASVLALDSKAKAHAGRWFAKTIDCTYARRSGAKGLRKAIDDACDKAEALARSGVPLLVLTHSARSPTRTPVPSLLVVGAVHHHLIRSGLRTETALFVQAGDAREVHDFCLLLGFGADAVNPFVAHRAVCDLYARGRLPDAASEADALEKYRYAAGKGMLKVMAKMGISTLQSYKGAQIFECVGLADDIVERCFPGTASRIGGASWDALAADFETLHALAVDSARLRNPGDYHARDHGEAHFNTPAGMADLQVAARSASSEAYKRYSEETTRASAAVTLRGLLRFDTSAPVPIEQVEPAKEIVKRFCTGAMSLGSISIEAHETLALAMNSMGARSNTGEGGEDAARFTWVGPNGESKRSAIKQVASGRFGVTSHYLANADQLQIKMAQGAKPGEGGELPGYKVTAQIAAVRGTTPGVGLISPPPHHDIYSIEDLAQLIFDLKNSNPVASVSVKLVSEVGVGVVAAGCAKAKADHITVSGGDGGTGAAAWTGVHKAGLPWELGLAEAHHTLVLNDLRSRVTLQTDGQIKTGRDVVVAALLGAEEVAFSTAPLIALGCIMMRKCHLNSCPVGIATQDPVLRAKFAGKPEHVVNFLFFLAEEARQYMAALGFKTFEDMIGRSDKLLLPAKESLHYKSAGLDLQHLLFPSKQLNETAGQYKQMAQDHKLDEALDNQLIAKAEHVLSGRDSAVAMQLAVSNLNRSVGTMLSYHVSKAFGKPGLPANSIQIKLKGSSGQSLGFALARGISIDLEGDANDYVGKALSGGRIAVRPPEELLATGFVPENNVIVGNVVLYGATAGEAYFRGKAGERFCVRNSGALAVVEGCGDHGCEYMTGGRVVVLGRTGRNFAAGMSGGVAYVLDVEGDFASKVNGDMVELGAVENPDELRALVEAQVRATASSVGIKLLADWSAALQRFVQVMPNDYKAVLEREAAVANADTGSVPTASEARRAVASSA